MMKNGRVVKICGRYTVLTEDEIIEVRQVIQEISMRLVKDDFENYSQKAGEIRPTDHSPVIIMQNDGILFENLKWGFKKWKGSGVIINARAETASEKGMFRKPLLERRCVVPSNGYYEWGRTSGRKKKDKYLLLPPGERIACMAGMMNVFRDAAGGEYGAFVILTTAASSTVGKIHDRMPVILAPEEHDLWISDAGFMEHVLHRPGPEMVAELVQA